MTNEGDGENILSSSSQPTGRWTVLGMFGFGVVMVFALWAYWELYTRPFRTLQYAIAAEFPGSSPRVIGGQHKSHKDETPKLLRIVASIPIEEFDPTQDVDRSEVRSLSLFRLAEQHQELSEYEQFEVHLVQRIPEQATKQWSVSRTIKQWRDRLERDPAQ